MFNTGQLLDESPACCNQQRIVFNLALIRHHGASTVFKPDHPTGNEVNAVIFKKPFQRQDQVFALANSRWNPDQTGQIDKLGLRRNHRNTRLRRTFAQFAYGGERGESGPENDNVWRSHGDS